MLRLIGFVPTIVTGLVLDALFGKPDDFTDYTSTTDPLDRPF